MAGAIVRIRALNVNPQRINIPLIEAQVLSYVRRFLDEVVSTLVIYPAPPPSSKYQRTYKLQGGWKVNVRRTASGVDGTLVNEATDRVSGRRYARYVQGPQQSIQHAATGWRKAEDIVKERQQEYRRGLQAIYNSAIRRGP